MRGYTAKKGNRYYAVIYEGVDPATGKERRRWYSAGPRKSDAEKLVTELVKRRNDGDYRAPEKITLGAYLTEKWLPVQRSQLKASTFDSYRRTIELHVLPTIGQVMLSRLLPEDLEGLYARLLESGRRNGNGGGLSPTSVRYVHRILRKALNDALRKGTIARNPAALADPPRGSGPAGAGHDMRVWSAAELQTFLALISTERLAPAYFLAAHTGMRRGEVLGLRWADVDASRKRISARQAVTAVAYQLRVSDVKTGTARRTIDVDDPVVTQLTTWRKRQAKERLLVGPAYEDHGLVFARPDGRPVHPEFLSRTFDRVVRSSGLPVIRFHDLRHTHATLLLKAGVPVKVVSERLGHASPGFTLNVYQHVVPGMQAEAAVAFSRLLSADPG
jgi:integrase